jgi:hypothetical protein
MVDPLIPTPARAAATPDHEQTITNPEIMGGVPSMRRRATVLSCYEPNDHHYGTHNEDNETSSSTYITTNRNNDDDSEKEDNSSTCKDPCAGTGLI